MTKWNQIKNEIETTRNMYSKSTKTYLNIVFTVLFLFFFVFGVYAGSLNASNTSQEKEEDSY
jgi:hypothetical protein